MSTKFDISGQINLPKRQTWVAYWISYLLEMQRKRDPFLATSNYHADKLREDLNHANASRSI
jgi:hypothetical protein